MLRQLSGSVEPLLKDKKNQLGDLARACVCVCVRACVCVCVRARARMYVCVSVRMGERE